MKAHLLFADRDPDISRNPLETQDDLVRDLDIGTVLAAMGGEDPFLHDFAAHVLLSGVPTVDDVQCRQQILTDCFAHPHEIQGLYDLAEHATQTKQRVRAFFMGDYPSGVLARSVALLRDLTDDLEQLRLFSAIHAHGFTSPGLRTFFAMIDRDLNEAYLATLRDHLRRLDFPNGVFMTAHLDDSCQGTDYVLRKPVSIRRSWGDLPPAGRLHVPGTANVADTREEQDQVAPADGTRRRRGMIDPRRPEQAVARNATIRRAPRAWNS